MWAINNGIQCAGIQDREMKRSNEALEALKDLHIFFFKKSESTALSFCFPGPF